MLVHPLPATSFPLHNPLSLDVTKPSPPISNGVVHFAETSSNTVTAVKGKPDIDELLSKATRTLIPHPIAFQAAQREVNAKPRNTLSPSSSPSLSSSGPPLKPPQANAIHPNGHTPAKSAAFPKLPPYSSPKLTPASSPKLSSSPSSSLIDDNRFHPPLFSLYPSSSLPSLSHWPSSITRPGVGFHNLGNSCFLNATLQALAHTPMLVSYCLSRHHSKHCTIKSQPPPPPPPAAPKLSPGQFRPFMSMSQPSSPLPPFCLFCALEDVIVKSFKSQQSFAPSAIFNRLPSISRSLKRGRQEDAHEFLRCALDMLQSNVLAIDLPNPPPSSKGVPARPLPLPKGSCMPPALFASLQSSQLHRVKETSILYQIYAGYYRSSLTCSACKHSSHTFEPFLDLSISIPTGSSPSSSSFPSRPFGYSFNAFHRFAPSNGLWSKPPTPALPPISLTDCLVDFTDPEHLDSSNMYRCASCKLRTKASKCLSIYRAPNVLVIHLKRFEHAGIGGGGKINRMVKFEPSLDLRPFMSEKKGGKVDYSLYAVLVHAGGSVMSGHYYSFVKAANGQWYEMNDQSVREATLHEVLSQKAYILFYTKDTVEGKDLVNGKVKEVGGNKEPAKPKTPIVEANGVTKVEASPTPAKLQNGVKINGHKVEEKKSIESPSDDSSSEEETEPKTDQKSTMEEKTATEQPSTPAATKISSPLRSLTSSSPSTPQTLSSPPRSPLSSPKKRKSFVLFPQTPSAGQLPAMRSFAMGSIAKLHAFTTKRLRHVEVLQMFQQYASDSDEEESKEAMSWKRKKEKHDGEEKKMEESKEEESDERNKALKEEGKEETKVEMEEIAVTASTIIEAQEVKEVKEAKEVKEERNVTAEEEKKDASAPLPPLTRPQHKRSIEEKDNGENEERRKRRMQNESRLSSTLSTSSPSSPPSITSTIRFDPHLHRHAVHSQYSTHIPSWDDDMSHEKERAEVLRELDRESNVKEKDDYDREYDRGRERKVKGQRDELAGAAIKDGENLLQKELEKRREEKKREEEGGYGDRRWERGRDDHRRHDRDGERGRHSHHRYHRHHDGDRGRRERHREGSHSSSSSHRRHSHSHSHRSSDRHDGSRHDSHHRHHHHRRHSDSHHSHSYRGHRS